jgi:hypothetical protein
MGYEVYRTTGTGTVYYFTSYVDGRTTVAFTDNIGDLTILENRVLEEHGDAPPTCYFCEPHKQRIWWLRTDAAPTRGYWSDPGCQRASSGTTTSTFQTPKPPETSSQAPSGTLRGCLWCSPSGPSGPSQELVRLLGISYDWTRTRTNAQIGAVTHRSVVRIPAGSKYTDQQGQLQTTAKTAIAYFHAAR